MTYLSFGAYFVMVSDDRSKLVLDKHVRQV